MIQGTASSVGKSLLVAGLCRIFKQDGFLTAPFKSQNMALNSFITAEGKEMGRAQVVQAEAAGIEPSVEMNPILLKPTTDKKAQVIIKGEVYGNMSAAEYHAFKPQLAGMVQAVYNCLAEKFEIVVIEGAGSPAEINLRDKDIVNMGMAELADAPVILVGDIDRGGVFAALAGTMLLLKEEEKQRVKGVIINKFRGDLEILKPGIRMIEEIIKVPVLGVIPYLQLNIDDEDSLAERFVTPRAGKQGEVDIVVVNVPHLSNFTDFNPFEQIPGVQLRYVESVQELGQPDMLVLPGSKNTIEDLLFLKKTGMEEAVKNLHRQGTIIWGICGGYQMLGKLISDPYQTESNLYRLSGMGLLNHTTVFQQRKVTTQVTAEITDNRGLMEGLTGQNITGYEIHMGTTELTSDCYPFLMLKTILDQAAEQVGGVRDKSGSVYGTYLHGLFDNMDFTWGLINNLRRKKGLAGLEKTGPCSDRYKAEQYDKLAAVIRKELDIDAIYRMLDKPLKRTGEETI
jgi:adenosylcobyric acid synthase